MAFFMLPIVRPILSGRRFTLNNKYIQIQTHEALAKGIPDMTFYIVQNVLKCTEFLL